MPILPSGKLCESPLRFAFRAYVQNKGACAENSRAYVHLNISRYYVKTPAKVSAASISVAAIVPLVVERGRERRGCLWIGGDFPEHRLCPSAKGRRVRSPVGARILPWLGRKRRRVRASHTNRTLSSSGGCSALEILRRCAAGFTTNRRRALAGVCAKKRPSNRHYTIKKNRQPPTRACVRA